MNIRVIRPDSWLRQPWRNGGGVTHEVLREGDPFRLRVSVAEVASSGPFSSFPGIDRVIVLLEGRGFVLEDPVSAVRLQTVAQPHPFAGETPIDCELVDGPVRDLNFMVDRRFYRIEVAGPGALPDAPRRLVFALEDGVTVQSGEQRWALGRHALLDAEGTGVLVVAGSAVTAMVRRAADEP